MKTCFECVVYEMLLQPLMKNSTYTSLQRSAYLCYWSAFFCSSSFWLGWEKNMLAECSSVVNTFTLPRSIQSSSFKLCMMITPVDTFFPVHTSFNNHTRLPFWWDLKQWQKFGPLLSLAFTYCCHLQLASCLRDLKNKRKSHQWNDWFSWKIMHADLFIVLCGIKDKCKLFFMLWDWHIVRALYTLEVQLNCALSVPSIFAMEDVILLNSGYCFLKGISKSFCSTLFNITHVGFSCAAWCIWGLCPWMK